MSEFSILGGPPSERTDDSEEPTDTDRESDTSTQTRRDPPPGDPTTASHRGRLYSLLALGLDRPGDDLEAALADGAYGDPLVESAGAIGEPVEDAAVAVAEAQARPDVEAATLERHWGSLFGVEEGVTVSPYELTYLPGPLLTNIRQLADIRGCYDAFGLEVGDEMPYRGDHVCYQTEFIGHLCLREAHLRRADDETGVSVVVDARRAVIEDHLGRWYWRFAGEVSEHDDGFYAALTDLLAVLVEDDLETLELEPEWVPDAPGVTEWSEDVFGDSGRSCGGCGADAAGLDEPMGGPPSGMPGDDGDVSLE